MDKSKLLIWLESYSAQNPPNSATVLLKEFLDAALPGINQEQVSILFKAFEDFCNNKIPKFDIDKFLADNPKSPATKLLKQWHNEDTFTKLLPELWGNVLNFCDKRTAGKTNLAAQQRPAYFAQAVKTADWAERDYSQQPTCEVVGKTSTYLEFLTDVFIERSDNPLIRIKTSPLPNADEQIVLKRPNGEAIVSKSDNKIYFRNFKEDTLLLTASAKIISIFIIKDKLFCCTEDGTLYEAGVDKWNWKTQPLGMPIANCVLSNDKLFFSDGSGKIAFYDVEKNSIELLAHIDNISNIPYRIAAVTDNYIFIEFMQGIKRGFITFNILYGLIINLNNKEIRQLTSIEPQVENLRYHPCQFINEKQIAYGGEGPTGNKIILFNPLDPTDNSRKNLIGHSSEVNALTMLGDYLVSGSADGTVRIWDITTGKTIHTLNQGGPVESLSVTPDGNLESRSENKILLWKFPELKPSLDESLQAASTSILHP